MTVLLAGLTSPAPNARQETAPTAGGQRLTHVPLPSASRPTLLVPRSARRAAAAAVRSHTVSPSAGARLRSRAATLLARAGTLRLARGGVALGGDDTFLEHLERVLGRDDLVCSVHLGPPRVNRKPVVRAMDRRGRPVAFAKLGITSLTQQRVGTEAEALASLATAETPGLIVPSVLEAGRWNDIEYLVLHPVDTLGGPASDALRQRAVRSLVDAFPVQRTALAEASWWLRLRTQLASTEATSSDVDRLLGAWSRVTDRWGGDVVATGAHHGDWSPWNTRRLGGDVVAWDWERFDRGRPVGWDEIHYELTACAAGTGVGARRLHDRILAAHGAGSVEEMLLATYLMHRGTSFVVNQHERHGTPNGPIAQWLLPVLEAASAPTTPR